MSVPEAEQKEGESSFYSSKGSATLFITTYIAESAHVLMQHNRMEEAMAAYKLMVLVSDASDRRAYPQGHAVLCEGLISIVQIGVTYLKDSYVKEGLVAGRRLLDELVWQRKQDAEKLGLQEKSARGLTKLNTNVNSGNRMFIGLLLIRWDAWKLPPIMQNCYMFE